MTGEPMDQQVKNTQKIETTDFPDAPVSRGEFCWTGPDGIVRCSEDHRRWVMMERPMAAFPKENAAMGPDWEGCL